MGSHPVAVVQYTFTHTHTHTQHAERILKECVSCPVVAGFTLVFALQLRKNTDKPQSG